MAKVPVIDIRPHDLEIVREILRRHVPNHEVLAFGSRVRWTARQYSDLDLVIRSDEAIPTDIIYAIKNELSESNLPMMVDVLDMASVSEKFRGIIEEEYAVVQEVKTTKPLGEVAEITMGQSPPGDTYNTEGDGLPFYQGVADFQGRYPKRRVYCTAPTRFAERGDILLSVRAPIGRVNLSTERCAIGRGLARIRALDSKDQTFLEFALRGESANWDILESQGSVFGSASKSDLMDLPIPWLERKERHATARILGALDDKIELNRRMNKTLEAMAQAIFKSWFVDFDPVHAKSKRRAPALPPALADLFPSQFQNSELGKIPRGWDVTTLGEVAEITKGRTYKSAELEPSDTALVTLKSFQRGGGYRPDGLKPYIGEYKPEQVVKSGELIISYTDVTQAGEVIGMPAIVLPTGEFSTLVASLDVGIVRSKVEYLSIPHLYHAFLTEHFRSHIYAYSTGTTVLHLSVKGVPEYKLVIPPKELCLHYKSLCEPLFRDASLNHGESCALGNVRDTLIPDLLSGKISSVHYQQRQNKEL
ncbi:MAG: restriction endonuclease subunit S [Gammaproteobacteria bacterium]|nr:restriction endonuclease subunit S [Gammaproteobacteria bacterium]